LFSTFNLTFTVQEREFERGLCQRSRARTA
jgi:hypothetical protein